MTGQLLGGHPVEPPLPRGAPVQVDAVHVGGHQEQVRGHVLGQQLAGQVLVDDRFHAGQGAGCGGRVHGRDAPAASADDHGPPVQQPGDRLDLQDLPGLGRRHHPAPRRPVLPERPALLGGQLVGVVLGVNRPHELGRMGERRVGRVHHDHREQGGHLLSPAAAGSAVPPGSGSRSCPGCPRPARPAGTARRPCTPRPEGTAGPPAGRYHAPPRRCARQPAARSPPAAILMFCRCASVVIGSPRRSSALPPRAITIRICPASSVGDVA